MRCSSSPSGATASSRRRRSRSKSPAWCASAARLRKEVEYVYPTRSSTLHRVVHHVLELALVRQPGPPEHGVVRVDLDGLGPPVRHPVSDPGDVPPAVERLLQDPLPGLVSRPRRVAPEERDRPVLGQVAGEATGEHVPVEPVKGVADGDEVDLALEGRVLDRCGHPLEVGETERIGPAPSDLDHRRLLVDGPDPAGPGGQRHRDLAGAAGEVDDPGAVAEAGPGPQVVEQGRRIRRSEAVIGSGRSPVEVVSIGLPTIHAADAGTGLTCRFR